MKILKFAFFSIAAMLVLSSCDKQLDLAPTDSFTPLNAFRTIADAQLGVNEAYARYTTYANTMYQSALVSDEAKLGNGNAGQGALTYRFQYSSDATTGGDVVNTYASFYFMIDQVNRVLAALPTVIATPAEEPRRNVLKGQLLALRAIAHFGLLQAYSKPYNAADPKGITYMTSSNVLATPARMTIGATVSAIETDLNDAFNLSPIVTVASFTDTVMNQLNINAYRARVALYKGDYANAITYSSAVISSAIRPLATPATFGNIWIDAAGSPETLFRIRTASSTAVGSLFTTTGGVIYVAPSNKLINSYGAGDVRKAATVGGTGPDAYYVNKFYTSSRGGRAVDVKAARTAEMYLIRAEAYAKSAAPNLALGTADVNTLRTQRISPYTAVTFATIGDLITAVADERYKELAFEGFRFFDLKRTGQPVQRDVTDVTSTAWQTLPAGNFRFVFPLPQEEILANPNSVQNDGY
jgi:hypothetical protein